jgi:hypothetical protein
MGRMFLGLVVCVACLAGGCHSNDPGSGTKVEVGPGGVKVDAPGTKVDVSPERGVHVHAPGTDVNVDREGVEVKTP